MFCLALKVILNHFTIHGAKASSCTIETHQYESICRANSGDIPGPLSAMDARYRCLKRMHYAQAITLCAAGICWIFAAQQLGATFYEPGSTLDCVLFANWTVKKKGSGHVLKLKTPGPETSCSLVLFGFAGIGIVAGILGWMYFFISPNRRAFLYQKSSRIADLVPFSAVILFGVLILALLAGAIFVKGFVYWCNHMAGTIPHCIDTSKLIEGSSKARQVFRTMITAQVFVWVGVVLWLVSILLLLVRFIKQMDFPPEAQDERWLVAPRSSETETSEILKRKALLKKLSKQKSVPNEEVLVERVSSGSSSSSDSYPLEERKRSNRSPDSSSRSQAVTLFTKTPRG